MYKLIIFLVTKYRCLYITSKVTPVFGYLALIVAVCITFLLPLQQITTNLMAENNINVLFYSLHLQNPTCHICWCIHRFGGLGYKHLEEPLFCLYNNIRKLTGNGSKTRKNEFRLCWLVTSILPVSLVKTLLTNIHFTADHENDSYHNVHDYIWCRRTYNHHLPYLVLMYCFQVKSPKT